MIVGLIQKRKKCSTALTNGFQDTYGDVSTVEAEEIQRAISGEARSGGQKLRLHEVAKPYGKRKVTQLNFCFKRNPPDVGGPRLESAHLPYRGCQ